MEHVSSWFQAALLPERWNVAGVSCSALSVWHVFALQSLENPYVCNGSVTREDAAALLLICSLDHRDGKQIFQDSCVKATAVNRILSKTRKESFEDIHAAVIDYLSTCSRVPGHKQPETKQGQKSSCASAPLCWVLVDFLSAGDPQKIEQAWDTPFAVAKCLFDARRNINGEDDTLESINEEVRFDKYLSEKR